MTGIHVRPGAFCGPCWSTGTTSKGTGMTCSPDSGSTGRARWRKGVAPVAAAPSVAADDAAVAGRRHRDGALFDADFAVAATGQTALDSPTFGRSRYPRPRGFTERMGTALYDYSGAVYQGVNRHLRGQHLPYGYAPEDVQPIIDGLDAAMQRSSLRTPVQLHRGITNARTMFGTRLDADLTGVEWREAAYTSTSVLPNRAGHFSVGEHAMQMRILGPAGTPAVEVSGEAYEAEVLLGRGLRFRVTRDRGRDPRGVRHVDVEVIA